ncbi:hypothetical protein [Asanoa siamensis]|uniref:Uncharacterized protein n=1 Tax=Asanoa siamensis TaxID=926357 RepID=A0ABQ4CH07_9ACTN|nr:hypothetical protein [Asanoa siamensis]GIF70576.1 hypothetical protein Asi02nite_00940 [Asanoa siamensis]
MIDLDPALRPWVDGAPAAWDVREAVRVAEDIAAVRSVGVDWEPGDEEWVHVVDERILAQISKFFPLALVLGDDLAEVFRSRHAEVTTVVITAADAEELRASPDLLQRTVLSAGWSDEFNPEQFSALDLFLESV